MVRHTVQACVINLMKKHDENPVTFLHLNARKKAVELTKWEPSLEAQKQTALHSMGQETRNANAKITSGITGDAA